MKTKQKTNNHSILKSDYLPEIYKEFCKDLPSQSIRSYENEKGEQIVLYGYQYYVNRLNNIVGIRHWHLTELPKYNNIYQQERGRYWCATVKVKLSLGNWNKDGKFIPIANRLSYGSGVHELRANALKGATTNGFKKTSAMFGIGKKEYEGMIEDYEIPTIFQKVTKKSKEFEVMTDKNLEQTKEIETLLMNAKCKNDFDNAKNEFERIKSQFTAKQMKYLIWLFEKNEQKFIK